jgi:FtsH-binding integral membrane protein
MTLFGYTTGRDLTKLGSLLIMALIGVVIASIANIFLRTELLYWPITIVGILVFIGLIAYDTQKLKRMALSLSENGEAAKKVSIIGALSLYLDFINLFLMLLRIFGKRRD